MLTRRDVLLGMGAGACAPAMAASNDHRLLTAADVHVDGYPTVEAVRWMGRRIETETNGRVRIRVYHSGQLGRESDTVELTRVGALDITRVFFGAINNPFPLTQIFALPYVFESVEHMRRAVDGEVGATVLRGFERRNLIGLAIYDSGSRSFYNVRRPVIEPKDLHGLKIRVAPSDIFIDLVETLGANPTPLPYGEVYSALQTHLVDGAENNWRSFHSSRHFEVARYLSRTLHSFAPEALLMSRLTFDALAPADREVVVTAARDSVAYMRELWDRAEAESRAHVASAGVKINEVDMAAFQNASRPLVEAYVKKSNLMQLYEAVRGLA
jgi:tripartite ATP-independent transporter DctP family solute receptor